MWDIYCLIDSSALSNECGQQFGHNSNKYSTKSFYTSPTLVLLVYLHTSSSLFDMAR